MIYCQSPQSNATWFSHGFHMVFPWLRLQTLVISDNQDSEVRLSSAPFYKNPLKPMFWTDNLQASFWSLEAPGWRS